MEVETCNVKTKKYLEYLSQSFPFVDGETEAQKGEVNYPGPHGSMANILLARVSFSEIMLPYHPPQSLRRKLLTVLEKTKGKYSFPFSNLAW